MKKRALYATDRGETCEFLTALLAGQGFEVVTVDSLLTALLVARGQVFSLYVLDAEFWGGAGARLCESIREFDPLAPVIFFAPAAETSAPREALAAGATRYVLKPDLSGLIEAVRDVSSGAASEPARAGSASQ